MSPGISLQVPRGKSTGPRRCQIQPQSIGSWNLGNIKLALKWMFNGQRLVTDEPVAVAFVQSRVWPHRWRLCRAGRTLKNRTSFFKQQRAYGGFPSKRKEKCNAMQCAEKEKGLPPILTASPILFHPITSHILSHCNLTFILGKCNLRIHGGRMSTWMEL